MKFKLINLPNPKYSAIEQILINRGITPENIKHYINLTDEDINDPIIFGKELMDEAAECLLTNLDADSIICVVVD